MSNDKKLGFDTLQIHGGAMPDATTGADKPHLPNNILCF